MTWDDFIAACIPTPATVSVQAYAGASGHGDTWATAADLGPCVVEHDRRIVTVQTVDAAGTQALSSATVYGPLDPAVEPGSLVTLPGDTRAARVLAVARVTAAGLPLPEHQELALE